MATDLEPHRRDQGANDNIHLTTTLEPKSSGIVWRSEQTQFAAFKPGKLKANINPQTRKHVNTNAYIGKAPTNSSS